jgi:zinc and cadmium transporter
MVLWRHCHTHDCEVHGVDFEHVKKHAAGQMILLGDAIHNMVDGVLIAAAFLTDVSVGVVTSVAVAAHEIPQELGSFAVLLHGNYGRRKALLYNILSSLTTVIGGVVAYFSLGFAMSLVPYVLAVAASSFIYIAVADLIPGLHKRPEFTATLQQISLILLGVGMIIFTDYILH